MKCFPHSFYVPDTEYDSIECLMAQERGSPQPSITIMKDSVSIPLTVP